ncbi:MAG: HAD family hydrolase [Calditrichaceae bacterium]|jgi:putative hydrolase of the HAD superfamily
MRHIKQIIFDADDTLWENNIYYLKAAKDFFQLLTKYGYNQPEIEIAFDQLEAEVVKKFGYGSINFIYILEELFRRFPVSDTFARSKLNLIIDEFNAHKTKKPSLFKRVPDTLKNLSTNYSLYILTKGDFEEQKLKIKNSGLIQYIKEYFILPEKNDNAYAKLLKKSKWQANETCMVGNSPKSDINPALRNDMYAVHIPYKNTWKLDVEPIISANGKFKQIPSFKDLNILFPNRLY